MASMERIFEIMDTAVRHSGQAGRESTCRRLTGRVDFDNVTFSYDA